MAANPVDDVSVGTNGSTAATNKVCNLPANVGAGPTLILLLRSAGADTHSLPAGWNWLVQNDASDGADDTTSILWKFADGTEGTTVTVNGTASLKFAATARRIRGGGTPVINTIVTGADTTPDPGDHAPAAGSQDYLWLWAGGWEGEQTSPPASSPTNYVNPAGADSGTGGAIATNCRVAMASRRLTAASENAPSWTISATDNWSAWSIAIPPAGDVVFTDYFNRADAALNDANWDPGYTTYNDLQIVGNEVRVSAVATGSAATINVAVGADQFAEFQLVTFTGAQLAEAQLWLRTNAPGSVTNYRFVAVRNDGTRTSYIERQTAGAGTTIASENATTWAAGDIMRAEAQGAGLRIYRNGTLVLQASDFNNGAGRPGCAAFIATGGSAANVEIDNFVTGVLSSKWAVPRGSMLNQAVKRAAFY